MRLSEKARAEIERRGPENVRSLLLLRWVAGVGQGAEVRLDLGADNPRRRDV
jgi:hypothetical protein